jgi:hypothetical protein
VALGELLLLWDFKAELSFETKKKKELTMKRPFSENTRAFGLEVPKTHTLTLNYLIETESSTNLNMSILGAPTERQPTPFLWTLVEKEIIQQSQLLNLLHTEVEYQLKQLLIYTL